MLQGCISRGLKSWVCISAWVLGLQSPLLSQPHIFPGPPLCPQRCAAIQRLDRLAQAPHSSQWYPLDPLELSLYELS